MIRSWKVYLLAGGVFIFSVATAFLVPTTGLLRELAAVPGVFALIAALYQVVRDQAAHERQIELQERQHFFSLGASSHMANVAFDKHVELSEQYIVAMQQGLEGLFKNGPTKEALNFSSTLQDVRLKYRPWITPEVQAKLMQFLNAHSLILEPPVLFSKTSL